LNNVITATIQFYTILLAEAFVIEEKISLCPSKLLTIQRYLNYIIALIRKDIKILEDKGHTQFWKIE